MTRMNLTVASILGAAGQGTILAQPPGVTPLPLLPGGLYAYGRAVSADGSAVAGDCETTSHTRAFRWTAASGSQNLGLLPGAIESFARGISANGSTVVGWSGPGWPDQQSGFRWTAATGMQPVVALPGMAYSDACAASGDGSVIVGYSYSPSAAPRAFRLVVGGPIQDLGSLPGMSEYRARAVSADGLVVAGECGGGNGRRAFRWTEQGGMEDLGTLAPSEWSTARSISADGSVIGGVSYPAGLFLPHPFRWTAAGLVGLGVPPGDCCASVSGVSGDGLTVIGDGSGGTTHAAYWTSATGMVDLNAHLQSLGISLNGWFLATGDAVNQNGRVLVATGVLTGPLWFPRALRVDLGPACYPDCNTDGQLTVADFGCFQTKFVAGDAYSDCNGDGVRTVADFGCFQTRFVGGCP